MSTGEAAAVLETALPTVMEPVSSANEADLVAGCRAGRREAFDEVVRRHYDRLYRLAYAMAGPSGAADLTQETFLAAVKALPGFRGESSLSTWLISILRNQYTLWLRGQRKWRNVPLEGEAARLPTPEAKPMEGMLKEIFEKMKELPEELRTSLVLFYVEGLKYAEIAEVMEVPVGTVRSRLFEARERLKRRVAPGAERSAP
ncbi:MAG TPA: sigma-70 family RNA polymerase sigma factor [Planctomycetota bacterium]|nr:sigma-70 family RNA polymerase sigma factor [Planctomycetota bacterium]